MSVIFRKEQIQQSITNENRKEGNVSQQGVTLVLAGCIQILNDDSGVLYNNAAHLDICAGRHFTYMSKTHT
jgi:hypothetical protein